MAAAHGSPALRRRLRVELRRARTKAKLTQKDVAQALDWSPSKVIRIESGQVAISITDLKALLSEYGVDDRATVEDLVNLARNSKKQPWAQYKDVLPPEAQAYYGYESSASIIRQFESQLVPGLLQTEDYTRALLDQAFKNEPRKAQRLVEARMGRQELLTREDVPEAFFIIDEAVIRRPIGGPEVMRAQLERLLKLMELPNVTLQIAAFSIGAYEGLEGPFVLMELADLVEADSGDAPSLDADQETGDLEDPEVDNFVLYLESRNGALIRDQPELMVQYLERFLELEKQAVTAEQSVDMVKEAVQQY